MMVAKDKRNIRLIAVAGLVFRVEMDRRQQSTRWYTRRKLANSAQQDAEKH